MIILTCICDIMQILRYFIKMYGFIKILCTDLYGFFKIRTMYGPDIPYNPYIVATLGLKEKSYCENTKKPELRILPIVL